MNIYYVGRNTDPIDPRNYCSPSHRHSVIAKTRLLRQDTSPSPQNQTRSSSCPKTQRSRYMKALHNMRQMSPVYKYNVVRIQKIVGETWHQLKENRNNDGIKNTQQQQQRTQKNRSKLSSAFQITKRNASHAKQEQCPRKIILKKVQQPRRKDKNVSWKLNNHQDQQKNNRYSIPQNGYQLAESELNKQIPQKRENRHEVESNVGMSEISQQQQNMLDYYKVQPMRKLFLCRRCYQFTPIFQLKSHYLACKIPLRKQQFILKWQKLIFLLEQCYRQQSTNPLFRLIDRMKEYIASCDPGKRQGYILYSEELAFILSIKGKIEVRCLWEEDLFWLIENLGDLIETKAIELDETAFWKICT